MLILYTITGCNSNKKLKEYLKNHQVEYQEKNLYKTLLDDKALEELLSYPIEKIINNKLLEEYQLRLKNKEELKELIRKNPILCRRPIVIGNMDKEINEIVDNNCDKRCSSYLVCGELFK